MAFTLDVCICFVSCILILILNICLCTLICIMHIRVQRQIKCGITAQCSIEQLCNTLLYFDLVLFNDLDAACMGVLECILNVLQSA